MRILKLEIGGFRSFQSQVWEPGELNILIGSNAGGKSNLLRLFEMLKYAAAGDLRGFIDREGGMGSVTWDGRADRMRVALKMSPLPPYDDPAKYHPADHALTYEMSIVRLGTTGAYRIDREVLANYCEVERGKATEPRKLFDRKGSEAVIFFMDRQKFVPPEDSVAAEESLLPIASGPFTVNRYIDAFQRELADWGIYQDFLTGRKSPVREEPVARVECRLAPDGGNLISVLHTHYTGSREFKREMNTALRAALGPAFRELVFGPAAPQRIQLGLRLRHLQRSLPAADLSDGTLRFLFLVTALASPEPSPLIAIDEPETGLHPRLLPIIAEYAHDASRRSQVVFTTHSPDFLDAFRGEAPTTTVVEWSAGQTELRVRSGDELEHWLKRFSLGELFRSRELENIG
jgi:predicted ATPase